MNLKLCGNVDNVDYILPYFYAVKNFPKAISLKASMAFDSINFGLLIQM